ncbi:MAG: hypothetical protein ACRD5L_11540 [Bryobacteraceae bacterium]
MNAMTCREFDEAVHGFVRMELLDVVVRELLLDHAAHCSNCADRMGEAKLLAEMTEAAAVNASHEEAPQRVEAALLSEFRKYHSHASWRRRFEWLASGAIAATLLFLAWTYGTREKDRSVPAPPKNVSSQSRAPVDASNSAAPQPAERAPESISETAVVKADTVATKMVASEKPEAGSSVTSDFVPVPFTDGIAPDDSSMVVRVQLTRASLAELGYPVAETPDEELIRADVLVGEDGWPRGVRLVQ